MVGGSSEVATIDSAGIRYGRVGVEAKNQGSWVAAVDTLPVRLCESPLQEHQTTDRRHWGEKTVRLTHCLGILYYDNPAHIHHLNIEMKT